MGPRSSHGQLLQRLLERNLALQATVKIQVQVQQCRLNQVLTLLGDTSGGSESDWEMSVASTDDAKPPQPADPFQQLHVTHHGGVVNPAAEHIYSQFPFPVLGDIMWTAALDELLGVVVHSCRVASGASRHRDGDDDENVWQQVADVCNRVLSLQESSYRQNAECTLKRPMSSMDCRLRFENVVACSSAPFSADEDRLLLDVVEGGRERRSGPDTWRKGAESIRKLSPGSPMRSPFQCAKRYQCILRQNYCVDAMSHGDADDEACYDERGALSDSGPHRVAIRDAYRRLTSITRQIGGMHLGAILLRVNNNFTASPITGDLDGPWIPLSRSIRSTIRATLLESKIEGCADAPRDEARRTKRKRSLGDENRTVIITVEHLVVSLLTMKAVSGDAAVTKVPPYGMREQLARFLDASFPALVESITAALSNEIDWDSQRTILRHDALPLNRLVAPGPKGFALPSYHARMCVLSANRVFQLQYVPDGAAATVEAAAQMVGKSVDTLRLEIGSVLSRVNVCGDVVTLAQRLFGDNIVVERWTAVTRQLQLLHMLHVEFARASMKIKYPAQRVTLMPSLGSVRIKTE